MHKPYIIRQTLCNNHRLKRCDDIRLMAAWYATDEQQRELLRKRFLEHASVRLPAVLSTTRWGDIISDVYSIVLVSIPSSASKLDSSHALFWHVLAEALESGEAVNEEDIEKTTAEG